MIISWLFLDSAFDTKLPNIKNVFFCSNLKSVVKMDKLVKMKFALNKGFPPI